MKVRDVIKRIETDGCVFARRGGRSSHVLSRKMALRQKSQYLGLGAMIYLLVSYRIYAESRG